MGVSGCTSCKAGGLESLQVLDRAYQTKLNKEAQSLTPEVDTKSGSIKSSGFENKPITGATIGSQINISA